MFRGLHENCHNLIELIIYFVLSAMLEKSDEETKKRSGVANHLSLNHQNVVTIVDDDAGQNDGQRSGCCG